MKKARLIQANRCQRGFTLIELMVTIAIAAILLSIAVPSFTATIRRNQITSQTNALVTAFALARSEASKRGLRVSLCSRNGNACSGTANWSAGWLVFTETDGDGALNTGAGEVLLQVAPDPPPGLTLTSNQVSVTFQSNGENFTPTTFTVSKSGCGVGEQKQITVDATGRANLAKQDCP